MDIARPELAQQKRRKRLIIAGVGALIFAASAYAILTMEPAMPSLDKATVWTDTVKRGDLMIEVRGVGVLVPKTTRWISAETNARVERIVVKPGTLVTADTVLAELSNPEVQDALLAARAAVTAARADLAAQQAQLQSQLLDSRANLAAVKAELASIELQAAAEKDLTAKGVIPKITFQRTELSRNQMALKVEIEAERVSHFSKTMDAQLQAARARLAQLDNTLNLRERQANALNVKAGIDGVLQQIAIEEGQQIQAGVNIARVAKPDVLMAQLKVPESQAKDVQINLSVRVDTRNGVIPGTVVRVDPAVKEGSVLVDVDLQGEMPVGARPDLSVDGVIEIAKLTDVLYVSRPAQGQPQSQTQLFRMQNNTREGTAERTPVTLGRASVSVIEISSGLKLGDRVILSDTSDVDRYTKIRVQ